MLPFFTSNSILKKIAKTTKWVRVSDSRFHSYLRIQNPYLFLLFFGIQICLGRRKLKLGELVIDVFDVEVNFIHTTAINRENLSLRFFQLGLKLILMIEFSD